MSFENLPPVLSLMAEERVWTADSPRDLKRHLTSSGLLDELKRQGEWSLSHYEYGVPRLDGLFTSPSGSLNPFSSLGKCGETACRIQAADEFVKTVSLYVDSAVVPDPFTAALQPNQRINFEWLFDQLLVFRQILPLAREGVVRFNSPIHHYCAECGRQVDENLSGTLERVVAEATVELEVEFHERDTGGLLGIKSPVLYPDVGHPLVLGIFLSSEDAEEYRRLSPAVERRGLSAELKDFIRPRMAARLKDEVSSVLFEMRAAQEAHATLVASSRLELLCVAEVNGSRPTLVDLERWEGVRSVDLPWVHELTTEECLILRSEARAALPKLRALLAARLGGGLDLQGDMCSVVRELRAQAAEVENELRGIHGLGETRYKIAMEGLAVTFVLYGLTSGMPAVAAGGLAGLLATLAHLQTGARDLAEKEAKLTAAPAFVLVKARELLSRRPDRVEIGARS